MMGVTGASRRDQRGRGYSMGLITDIDSAAEGYEAVSLPLLPEDPSGTQGLDGRCSAAAAPADQAGRDLPALPGRPVRAPELASWYTDRGFHFYVADLRRLADAAGWRPATPCRTARRNSAPTSAAWTPPRSTSGRPTGWRPWCSAHTPPGRWSPRSGATPARQPARGRAILASPALRAGSWLARLAGGRRRRAAPLLAVLRRRVRHGLDISCPVLVLCPATDWDATSATGGPAPSATGLASGQATMRLGPHVTWRKVEEAGPAGTGLPQLLDEQGRWLGAYLSGQARDQLLQTGWILARVPSAPGR